jgi:hypothetical protein
VNPSLFASQEALKEGDKVKIYRFIESSDDLSRGSKYTKLPEFGLWAVVTRKSHLPNGKPQFDVQVSHPCSLDGSLLLVDTACFNVFRPTKLGTLMNILIDGLMLLHALRSPYYHNPD